jgi:uncharacterized protein (DUF58 family)
MKLIKITKSGYLYIILTILLGFAAINTGNNLVYLIDSALLGFMGVSGFFGKKNIYSLDLEIIFPEEVFANREFPLKIKLTNKRKFIPSFLIKVHIGNNRLLFPFINEKSSTAKNLTYKFHKRGNNIIKNVYISSSFPFNFFIRFNYIKKSYKKIVFPEPLEIKGNVFMDSFKNTIGENNINSKGYTGDILYLRDYRENDSIKSIHWKLSANYTDLIVKILSINSDTPTVIDFNKLNVPNIEKKISFITFLVLNSAKFGKKIFLKMGNELIKNKHNILKKLALL